MPDGSDPENSLLWSGKGLGVVNEAPAWVIRF